MCKLETPRPSFSFRTFNPLRLPCLDYLDIYLKTTFIRSPSLPRTLFRANPTLSDDTGPAEVDYLEAEHDCFIYIYNITLLSEQCK